jgi:hypothetical protein
VSGEGRGGVDASLSWKYPLLAQRAREEWALWVNPAVDVVHLQRESLLSFAPLPRPFDFAQGRRGRLGLGGSWGFPRYNRPQSSKA